MTSLEGQVIMAQLAAIRDDVREIKDEDLAEIKAHVTQTNGRVKKLELWQASVDGFRRGVGLSFSWVPAVVSGVIVGVIVGAVAALTPIL